MSSKMDLWHFPALFKACAAQMPGNLYFWLRFQTLLQNKRITTGCVLVFVSFRDDQSCVVMMDKVETVLVIDLLSVWFKSVHMHSRSDRFLGSLFYDYLHCLERSIIFHLSFCDLMSWIAFCFMPHFENRDFLLELLPA